MRYTDRAEAPDGTVVYANRGVVFAKIAWGKLTYYGINQDTQKIAELDEWLVSREPACGWEVR